MIAAICACRNEADIIEVSLRHILAEGIDHIFISDGCSTDGTRDIIDTIATETGRLTVYTDDEPTFRQVYWMNFLADQAAIAGAEWIIPNDIDEFWYGCDGSKLADVLKSSLNSKLYARSYGHHGWDMREVEPKRLPKVAYRWQPGTQLVIGNHDVNLDGGTYDVIDLRELQYRSYEHFKEKTSTHTAMLPADARAVGAGWHHTRLEGMSEEQLQSEWNALLAIPTTYDPIPLRVTHD